MQVGGKEAAVSSQRGAGSRCKVRLRVYEQVLALLLLLEVVRQLRDQRVHEDDRREEQYSAHWLVRVDTTGCYEGPFCCARGRVATDTHLATENHCKRVGQVYGNTSL